MGQCQNGICFFRRISRSLKIKCHFFGYCCKCNVAIRKEKRPGCLFLFQIPKKIKTRHLVFDPWLFSQRLMQQKKQLSYYLCIQNSNKTTSHFKVIIQISGIEQEHGKDRLSEIYMATFFKVFGFVALWCQVWFWIIVWGAYCQIKRFVHKRDPVDRCCAHCFPCCC